MSQHPATTDKRRTQEERKSTAEEALLAAAEEIIAEEGLERATLGKIGLRAGYSRGLVNHHFGSKKILVERLAQRMQGDFARTVRFNKKDSGRTQLLKTIQAYFKRKHLRGSQGGTFLLMWASAIATGAESGFADVDRRAQQRIRGLIERGINDGSIQHTIDPNPLAMIILGMMRGIAIQALIDPKRINLAREQSTILQFLDRAI